MAGSLAWGQLTPALWRIATPQEPLDRIKGVRGVMVDSFDGSLRDGCLNEEIVDSLADACQKLAPGRYDDNNVRPH